MAVVPEDIKIVLKKHWGYSEFKGSQERIIQEILEGKDVLALLPTGGGKSLCYQLPALMMDGICIVISPLIALIQDQVTHLNKRGIKAFSILGGIRTDELSDLLDNGVYGNYKFLFLSPERLLQPLVLERLQQMKVHLIAVDEAHCISLWGNDFRPAYRHCGELRSLFPKTPMIALSGTANSEVCIDIVEQLRMTEPQIFKDSLERKNIALSVKKHEDKLYQLRAFISKTEGSGIVYVRSRKMTVQLAQFLAQHQLKAQAFHGGHTRSEKSAKLQAWMSNSIPIMVATNAFGMGIDKADVRWIVHFQIPDALENYFQEVGRAGRDGKASKAVLLLGPEDQLTAKTYFIDSLPSIPFLKKLYKNLNSYFQIAYGEGTDLTFPFNFADFCNRYELPFRKTQEGLKLLDQHSIISLSTATRQSVTMQFIASQKTLFSYLEANPSIHPMAQALLRTYGGITEYETAINPLLLARKTKTTEHIVMAALRQLYKNKLIELVDDRQDVQIRFLVPREDDRTIHPIAWRLEQLLDSKKQKMNSMLEYVNHTSRCRNKLVMDYFGETKLEDCNKCDICLEIKLTTPSEKNTIQQHILNFITAESRTSREIVAHLSADKKDILEGIRQLLEAHQIVLNEQNQYGRKK